ncbi:DUF4251 domain-containing protein [uncultured Alistipes sp.]|uniref:DUF4251 domain-containing protein n=1 Tax=uncultured Alistipes sp. TaxID=538949 RepID=UPI001F9E6CBD|nr:DUF4251 domain-containing protein [uncultured Alistipes sp.]HJC17528.1 DUF4251 domain-containing protein [Candidatus Alistipes stercorigallinarum]
MLLTLILMLALGFGATSTARAQSPELQQEELTRAQKRKVRKQLEAIQDSLDYAAAVKALQERNFVMSADQLVFKHGETAFVTSATNFVSLTGDDAVVQIAPFNSGGPNGVGGITVEGKASSVKVDRDKRGTLLFSMNVSGLGISAMVTISLPEGSNRASLLVESMYRSGRITLNGRLLPYDRRSVVQGASL